MLGDSLPMEEAVYKGSDSAQLGGGDLIIRSERIK